MAYGQVEYNEYGQPKCEICGEHYDRVISHVRQKHEISAREYKIMFGFDLKRGICSKESAARTREKTLQHYDKCIGKNLLDGGKKSRFKKGSPGRTRDKVSAQTLLRLKKHFNKISKHTKNEQIRSTSTL